MYSYEDRIRAVELYIKLGKRVRPTIRQLGYPTRNSLKGWYNEYRQKLDLPACSPWPHSAAPRGWRVSLSCRRAGGRITRAADRLLRKHPRTEKGLECIAPPTTSTVGAS